MIRKTCPVCKKKVEVSDILGRPRLNLHGPGRDDQKYCSGSYKNVKIKKKELK